MKLLSAPFARWLARIVAGLALVPACGLFGYETLDLSPANRLAEHCSNLVSDEDEASTDCGGSCLACAVGSACRVGADCLSAVCSGAICEAPSCQDGVQNAEEAGIDCGGTQCNPCPSCADGIQNQAEGGVDCGGESCAACDGSGCVASADCGSSNCVDSICQPPTCADGVQNQGETGVDCGGAPCAPCPTCADGSQNQDETGVDCGGALCAPCPTCFDGSQNQDETGVDCGGALCAPCPTCFDGSQNQDETGVDCGGALCAPCPPTCFDGSQNQDETAVDCGGALCAPCPTCFDGSQNQDETAVDCGGALCAPCPTCFDGSQNQDETGVDCGGSSCAACPAPTCFDGSQNQDETGVDCGGSQCAACPPTCFDGSQNQDETGVDCGGSSCAACGANTPPLARMLITPGIGSNDGSPTLFQGDAGATSDLQDAPGALTYSWDWDNDGLADAAGVTSTHTYSIAGTYAARLSVQDTGGLSATATFLVIVTSASDIVQVTTAADENDSGATPGTPNGTGLSLREAITYANATAGKQSILVPAGFSIALTDQLPSPTDLAGVDIVGDGAVWNGSGTGPADDCIQTSAPQTRIFGFEIRNCRRSPLRLGFGAAGSQFSRLYIHDYSQPIILNDANVTFGPYNEVSGSAGTCIGVVGFSATIEWNYIHDCATRGIDLTGTSDGALIIGNVITRSNPGIFFGSGASDCRLLHNVLHANLGDGVWVGGATNSSNLLQNNILSNNAGYGVRATDDKFTTNDHNDYFGNAQGTCTECSLGAGSLLSDPLYLSPATGDFRLQLSSPNVNAGIDTGQDVNGPAPGNGLFNGSNPDIGANEAP